MTIPTFENLLMDEMNELGGRNILSMIKLAKNQKFHWTECNRIHFEKTHNLLLAASFWRLLSNFPRSWEKFRNFTRISEFACGSQIMGESGVSTAMQHTVQITDYVSYLERKPWVWWRKGAPWGKWVAKGNSELKIYFIHSKWCCWVDPILQKECNTIVAMLLQNGSSKKHGAVI